MIAKNGSVVGFWRLEPRPGHAHLAHADNFVGAVFDVTRRFGHMMIWASVVLAGQCQLETFIAK